MAVTKALAYPIDRSSRRLRPVHVVKFNYSELEYVLEIVATGENGDLPCGPVIDIFIDVGADEVGYMNKLAFLPSVKDTLQILPAGWLLFGVLANKAEEAIDMTGLAVKHYKSLASLRPGDLVRRRFSEMCTRLSHRPLNEESNSPVRHEQIRMYPHHSIVAFDYQIGCRVIISFYVLRIEIGWRR
jgi:hypothetical protein